MTNATPLPYGLQLSAITYYLLPITHYPLPITHYQLPRTIPLFITLLCNAKNIYNRSRIIPIIIVVSFTAI
ncbi:hypothetical protein [Mastigocoleus testarum]|uniref:hypothetical protein n=1 Tax=Mastigocoleus testarum TaxID=996925 RepID=UPI000A85D979|nr:hypothetical protein [Mastigocoleus testarum]